MRFRESGMSKQEWDKQEQLRQAKEQMAALKQQRLRTPRATEKAPQAKRTSDAPKQQQAAEESGLEQWILWETGSHE